MNIFEKVQIVKEKLSKKNLKKSGENKFAGFRYYELADFLPSIIELCSEEKLFTHIDFDNESQNGVLTIINVEEPNERITYHSQLETLEMKGCNKIQALGGVQTYTRRYLYMNAFDIVESDLFDSADGETNESAKVVEKKITPNQLKMLETILTEEEKESVIEKWGKLEDLTMAQASQLIKKKGK